MRLLFAGGGTAGHIYPALAIANYFCKKDKDCEIMFVGTKEGLETELIPRSGYPIEFIKVHGIRRSFTLKNFKNVTEIPVAIHNAGKIIKKFKPDAVIGTGGYVSGPVLYAAAKAKIPTLIHESNAFPGVTTKILSGYVDTVAVGVEDAKKYLGKAKNIVVTGTPLRASLLENTYESAREKLGLDERPFFVIFGGSLGAKHFNHTIANWISEILKEDKYQILMGTGKRNQYNDVMEIFKENGINLDEFPSVKISEYIYNMDVAMAAADIVISRAGASTLCELTALGKPAILVPSPYVTGNHQEHNARAVERGGGAVVITEDDFTSEKLKETIENLTSDKDKLSKMSESSRKMGHIDVLDVLYSEINKIIEK